ncbi:protein of unknown function [Cyanobium sp. NIES-981]|nr:protein of unknown function [Cyanobium sp. NIES-981]
MAKQLHGRWSSRCLRILEVSLRPRGCTADLAGQASGDSHEEPGTARPIPPCLEQPTAKR